MNIDHSSPLTVTMFHLAEAENAAVAFAHIVKKQHLHNLV